MSQAQVKPTVHHRGLCVDCGGWCHCPALTGSVTWSPQCSPLLCGNDKHMYFDGSCASNNIWTKKPLTSLSHPHNLESEPAHLQWLGICSLRWSASLPSMISSPVNIFTFTFIYYVNVSTCSGESHVQMTNIYKPGGEPTTHTLTKGLSILSFECGVVWLNPQSLCGLWTV